MAEELWLVKVRRYGGGESVVRQHSDKGLAEDQAAAWNQQYQTDAAYVEKWEASKSDWPGRVNAVTNDPHRIERRKSITPGVTVRRRG